MPTATRIGKINLDAIDTLHTVHGALQLWMEMLLASSKLGNILTLENIAEII